MNRIEKNIMVDEIVDSLSPLNHIYFHVEDLHEYASKIVRLGKCISLRRVDSNELIAYVLYYDNMSKLYISMVWTSPRYQRNGIAKKLLKEVIKESSKDIYLEVNRLNPAKLFYEGLKFKKEKEIGNSIIMRYSKRLSIMQPYTFPYMGYFHLIEASDMIVFYDDVNFIKRGWINRNRILLDNKPFFFTIPLEKASQNKKINEIIPIIDRKIKNKLFMQVKHAYKKAPFYDEIIQVVFSALNKNYDSIADLGINSIKSIYDYLGKEIRYLKSSVCSSSTKEMDKADRLIQITKGLGYKNYVNLIGGMDLYNKEYFKKEGVKLRFVKSNDFTYRQFQNQHVPFLSVIDVLMFNEKERAKEMLTSYEVV